jgi:hypothetical protein
MLDDPCFQSCINRYVAETAPRDFDEQFLISACTIYEEARTMLATYEETRDRDADIIIPGMKKMWKYNVQKKKNEFNEPSISDYCHPLADMVTFFTDNECGMFWKSVAAKDHLLMTDPDILAYVGLDAMCSDSSCEESPEEEIERSMCLLYQ